MKEKVQVGGRHFTLIDLTHPLNESIPTWDGSEGFRLSEEERIRLLTNSGTHIDAPSYFAEKRASVDEIPLSQLFAPACLIDVSAHAKADMRIGRDEIEMYEKEHGAIPEKSIVVAFTGWSRFWSVPEEYRNPDQAGALRFPTFGISAIELLLERDVAGVAIDTLALEPLDSDYSCHRMLMDEGKFIIENIANAHRLPPKGAFIIALPLKIEGGVEAPARVIALI